MTRVNLIIQLVGLDNVNNYEHVKDFIDSYAVSICSFLTEQVLDDYSERYRSHDIRDPIWLNVKPLDLLLAGKHLAQLATEQNAQVIDQLRKKFRNLGNSASNLADLLAEVEVAAHISPYFKIELNKKTGAGMRDSDIWIAKLGLFVEVKNFQQGRSSFEQQAAEEMTTFDASSGGQYSLDRSGKINKIGENTDFFSMDLSAYDPGKQLFGYIHDTHLKFALDQKAILFITGGVESQAGASLAEWLYQLDGNTPIQGVIAIGPRHSATNIKRIVILRETQDKQLQEFFSRLLSK